MSFSTWEKRIEIEKYAFNKTYDSTTVYTPFSKFLEGTYFVSFSPMLRGVDKILSVACKIGSNLDTDLENLVAYYKTSPTDYKNMIYEQLCMSGVYISDGYDLKIKIALIIDNDDQWYLENLNPQSFSLSLIKLA
jgi:hypothetical protein